MSPTNPDIPKTCKAGICHNPGPDFTMTVEEVPVPTPGPDELLIKLNVTGICFSDIHYMLEDLGLPRMGDFGVKSVGHEGAGIVVAKGDQVQDWKIGDRAGIKPLWSVCQQCELCWGRHETHCPKMLFTGIQKPGTYQQYIVSPARYTSPIPEGVDDSSAGPIMCSGSTIYRSLKESGLQPGDWAVFPGGGGGVGHMGVQLAKAMGMRVIAVDGGNEKRKMCMSLGAEEFVDFTEVKSVEEEEEVMRITDGKGANGVFVTATSKTAYETAPLMVCTGGRVMCIGLPPSGTATCGADPGYYIFKNLVVTGTLVGSMQDTNEALKYAARGLLRPRYEKFGIDDLPKAVQKLRDGKVSGRCVVNFNS